MTKYERRKAEGLCVKCGKPAVPGRILCAECASKNNAKCKETYEWRKANGICTGCGKEKADPGVTRCWRCRLNMNAASMVSHAARYQEAADAGVCARCGAPVGEGHKLCEACLEKQREYNRERRRKQ